MQVNLEPTGQLVYAATATLQAGTSAPGRGYQWWQVLGRGL